MKYLILFIFAMFSPLVHATSQVEACKQIGAVVAEHMSLPRSGLPFKDAENYIRKMYGSDRKAYDVGRFAIDTAYLMYEKFPEITDESVANATFRTCIKASVGASISNVKNL